MPEVSVRLHGYRNNHGEAWPGSSNTGIETARTSVQYKSNSNPVLRQHKPCNNFQSGSIRNVSLSGKTNFTHPGIPSCISTATRLQQAKAQAF